MCVCARTRACVAFVRTKLPFRKQCWQLAFASHTAHRQKLLVKKQYTKREKRGKGKLKREREREIHRKKERNRETRESEEKIERILKKILKKLNNL